MQEKKTPWNPSKKAEARVKAPLPQPQKCNHCSAPVEIVSNSQIYGKEYGEWPWAFLCIGCGAYVGLHPFTGIPLGTLANKQEREARKRAKAAFNPKWEKGGMSRTAAYKWLAEQMGIIDFNQCHIGWFDVQQCERVVELCKHSPIRASAPGIRVTRPKVIPEGCACDVAPWDDCEHTEMAARRSMQEMLGQE